MRLQELLPQRTPSSGKVYTRGKADTCNHPTGSWRENLILLLQRYVLTAGTSKVPKAMASSLLCVGKNAIVLGTLEVHAAHKPHESR